MPVGVPRVPFRNPGDENKSWVDIYNRLYRERLLFLGQPVDNAIANQLVALMIYLSIEDYTKDIFLFINSPGGWLVPGVSLYDTMQFVRSDVPTVCMGLAASMGSFLLIGGQITKRLAFPHARVMIHQPASSFYETRTAEFLVESAELMKLREAITRVYIQRTGKPSWIIYEDMERDVFLSAKEAQAHGIVDYVALHDDQN